MLDGFFVRDKNTLEIVLTNRRKIKNADWNQICLLECYSFTKYCYHAAIIIIIIIDIVYKRTLGYTKSIFVIVR